MTPNKKPKPKYVRKKKGESKIGEESAIDLLWAVSYTDMLMVLLAFFVLYFEFSESLDAPPPLIDGVVMALKDRVNDIPGEGQGLGAGADDVSSQFARKGLGPGAGSGAARFPERIDIFFTDELYAPGSTELTKEARDKIREVMTLVKPYWQQMELTFIGHADSTGVTRKLAGEHAADSNRFLSMVRAAKAADFAESLGFQKEWIKAQGAGTGPRNARTLSLRITERR